MKDKYPKVIFEFERGSFDGGMLRYEITEYEDVLFFEGRCCNAFVFMPDYSFFMPKDALTDLIEELKGIRSWRHNKVMPGILDGYGYTININYGGLRFSKNGYEAYPFNSEKIYHEHVRKIQNEIEKLCEKYTKDYSTDEKDKRLNL